MGALSWVLMAPESCPEQDIEILEWTSLTTRRERLLTPGRSDIVELDQDDVLQVRVEHCSLQRSGSHLNTL